MRSTERGRGSERGKKNLWEWEAYENAVRSWLRCFTGNLITRGNKGLSCRAKHSTTYTQCTCNPLMNMVQTHPNPTKKLGACSNYKVPLLKWLKRLEMQFEILATTVSPNTCLKLRKGFLTLKTGIKIIIILKSVCFWPVLHTRHHHVELCNMA